MTPTCPYCWDQFLTMAEMIAHQAKCPQRPKPKQ